MRFHAWFMLFVIFCASCVASNATDESPKPTPDQIISQMLARNLQRQILLGQYRGMRQYVLENEGLHKRAQMLVRITYHPDGSKHFEIVSEEGWEAANKHVLRKMIASEEETSGPELREKTQLNFVNYDFTEAGTETIGGRLTYILEASPKRHDKYLFHGRIWIDAEDFALVQAEGEPAKNPSFWTRHIQFTQHYTKNGEFWFAAGTQSVTQALIFGKTDVTINYFGYDTKLQTIESPVTENIESHDRLR